MDRCGYGGASDLAGGIEVSKYFFFEKKKQKTFTHSKSFLVLFFKKELLPYTNLACLTDAAMNPANSGCGSNGFDFSSG
jgi:hypothetical protein